MKKMSGLYLILLNLIFGCGILAERPNDPPPVNDHDANLIGSWKNDSSAKIIKFDGSEIISTVCDTSKCLKNIFTYRTYTGSIYKDFITTENCDLNGNYCNKAFESPSNIVESYEIYSSLDSLIISQIKYYKIQ